MRITNAMTNQIAADAGLPIYSSSALLEDLKSDSRAVMKEDLSSTGIYTLKSNRYEELEQKADRLAVSAETFTTANIDAFVEHYNEVITSLKGTSSVLNDYYRQMMEETAAENSTILRKLGITLGKNGTLNYDKTLQEKLDTIELFLGKIAFLAQRISSNARANTESLSSRYNASGSVTADVVSKFHLWG